MKSHPLTFMPTDFFNSLAEDWCSSTVSCPPRESHCNIKSVCLELDTQHKHFEWTLQRACKVSKPLPSKRDLNWPNGLHTPETDLETTSATIEPPLKIFASILEPSAPWARTCTLQALSVGFEAVSLPSVWPAGATSMAHDGTIWLMTWYVYNFYEYNLKKIYLSYISHMIWFICMYVM